MKKLIILLVGIAFAISFMESCISSRSCPAYGTVRETSARKR